MRDKNGRYHRGEKEKTPGRSHDHGLFRRSLRVKTSSYEMSYNYETAAEN